MKVFVKISDGKTINLNVESNITIGHLKEKIEVMERIPREKQILIFLGVQQKDEHILSECNITEKSTLYLVLREKFQIFVKTLSNKTFTLEVMPGEEMKSVKYKIYAKFEVEPECQHLIFAGKNVDDETRLDYNVHNNQIFHLIIQWSGENRLKMQIFVNISSDKDITLYVEPNMTIMHLKAKIEVMERIPRDKQILIFSGEQKKDEYTLSDCNIEEKSTLNLVLREKFPIFVQTFNGGTISLEVMPDEEIKSVKERICDKLEIEQSRIKNIRFIFASHDLHDKTVLDYNIKKNKTIYLIGKLLSCKKCSGC